MSPADFGRRGARVGRLAALVFASVLSCPIVHAQSLEGLSVVAPLRFGTMAVLGAGAVTLFPQGSRLADGQVYLVGPDSGSPAQLLVTSRTPNMSFSLSMPAGFSLTSQNGADSLSVVNLTKAPIVASTGPTASTTVTIGGTLQITGIPGPGTYMGSFPIAVVWP